MKLHVIKSYLDLSKTPRKLDLTKKKIPFKKIVDIVPQVKKNKKVISEIHFLEILSPFFEHKFSESLRVFVGGIIILFFLQIVNIYYQGIGIKKKISVYAFSAVEKILTLPEKVKQKDFNSINTAFKGALEDFSKADNQVWFLKGDLNLENTQKNILTVAKTIIGTGKSLSKAGIIFSDSAKNLYQLKNIFLTSFISGTNAKGDSLTEKIKDEFKNIQKGLNEIKQSDLEMKNIKETILPKNYQDKFKKIKDEIGEMASYSKDVEKYFPAFLDFLGDRYPRKYLILFANNNEQRAIMGFLGSGMIIEFNDGYVTENKVFDVYSYDGQIVEKIELPKVFESITGNWGLRDSNYSPDGILSAKKASYLYEKGGGEGVDGVIFIDLNFLNEILKITGPIKVPSLNKEVKAENFDQLLSYIIESKMEGKEDPKNILKRMLPEVLKKIGNDNNILSFLAVLPNLIQEKHIIAYSKIDEIQNLFKYLELTGEVTKPLEKEDYLSVINTSISGNKSDYYIKEKINQKTIIQKDGVLVNEVTIQREHTFDTADEKALLQMGTDYSLPPLTSELKKTLGQGINKVSVRVYVPNGSRLKNVVGKKESEVEVRHDDDLNLVYFQTLLQVAQGEKTEVKFIYELPYKLNFEASPKLDNYVFKIQKQAGSMGRIFHKEIIFPQNLKVYKKIPNNDLKTTRGKIEFNSSLDKDRMMGIVFGF